MKVCYYVPVQDKNIIDRVLFYSTDLRILRELGHDVIVATRFKEIPFGCDLYFVWWWTWAFLPAIKSLPGFKPLIISGVFDYGEKSLKGVGNFYIYRPYWQRFLIKICMLNATSNILVSRYEFNQIRLKLGVKNIEYIPLAVDTSYFKPSTRYAPPFLLNIAWSSSLNAARKCLMQIIESFSIIVNEIPDIRLVMAGTPGDYHSVLVDRARELKLIDRIDFLGVITEDKKLDLMQQCAVYLQPTIHEGFGLAIAEAMACGAIVVSSPVGSIPEVVADAGVMIDSTTDIATAVLKILDDTELQIRLRCKSRERIVDKFSYEARRDSIDNLISRFLKN